MAGSGSAYKGDDIGIGPSRGGWGGGKSKVKLNKHGWDPPSKTKAKTKANPNRKTMVELSETASKAKAKAKRKAKLLSAHRKTMVDKGGRAAADAKAKKVLREMAAAKKSGAKVSTTPGKAGLVKPKKSPKGYEAKDGGAAKKMRKIKVPGAKEWYYAVNAAAATAALALAAKKSKEAKGKKQPRGKSMTPGEYEPRKSRPYSKRKSTAKKYPAGSAKKQAIHNTKKAAIPGWLGHSLYDEKAKRILRERDHKDLRPSERTPTESNPAKDQKTKGKK